MLGNRDVQEFLLELDTPNALDEVVVLKYDRLFLSLAETSVELREDPDDVVRTF